MCTENGWSFASCKCHHGLSFSGSSTREVNEGNGMKKYMVIYHAPMSAAEQMQSATPERMQEGMKAWMAWAEGCGDGLVDMGTPLGGGQKMTESGASPSDKSVMGYSVLQAEDMEGAQALLKGHPHLGWNADCEIEVHESMPLPM